MARGQRHRLLRVSHLQEIIRFNLHLECPVGNTAQLYPHRLHENAPWAKITSFVFFWLSQRSLPSGPTTLLRPWACSKAAANAAQQLADSRSDRFDLPLRERLSEDFLGVSRILLPFTFSFSFVFLTEGCTWRSHRGTKSCFIGFRLRITSPLRPLTSCKRRETVS